MVSSLDVAAAAESVEPVVPCFVTPAGDVAIDARIDCGYVVVPQNPDAPNGQTVKLAIVRIGARNGQPAAPARAKTAPLFILAGGPGSSLIDASTLGLSH